MYCVVFPDAHYSPLTTSCSLLTAPCSLLPAHCSLLTAPCSVLTAHLSLPTTSHCQVVSSIEEIYYVVFPDVLSEFIVALQRLVNVEIVTLGVPLECIGISSFHSKLTLYIITPAALICAIFAVAVIRRAVNGQRVCIGFLMDGLPLALLVAFLSLPPVTSLAARAFLIECFDSGECYMRTDLSVHAGLCILLLITCKLTYPSTQVHA